MDQMIMCNVKDGAYSDNPMQGITNFAVFLSSLQHFRIFLAYRFSTSPCKLHSR